jgi:hypothetical protein
VLVADGWCHGRRYAWLLSLCRLWVLIASIAGIIIGIGVYRIVAVAAADLFMRVLVPPLLSPFPRLRLVA